MEIIDQTLSQDSLFVLHANKSDEKMQNEMKRKTKRKIEKLGKNNKRKILNCRVSTEKSKSNNVPKSNADNRLRNPMQKPIFIYLRFDLINV